jgi:hypothetical protein
MVDNSKSKGIMPPEEEVSGALTLGYQGSEELHTGYADLLQPLHEASGLVVFYNGRFTIDDSDQLVHNHGLVFRYLVPNQDIIIGANVYYDSLDSAYHHHFDQAGLGFEILTRWVDARVNYYLPDQKREITSRQTRRELIREIERGFTDDLVIETELRREFVAFEAPLEGVNAELGFLIPGLDRYAEVRLFGGYYHYLNPFGRDYDGFKARLEAYITRGIVADVQYWEDAALTGGHWTGSIRMSLPFNLGNIFAGRNPFEGASEAFQVGPREFPERLSEMVIRSHRVRTASSGPPQLVGSTGNTTFRRIPKNLPPGGGNGGGGEEGSEGSEIPPETPPPARLR